MKTLRVNMVSESDLYPQGHGVHTAYTEIASALEARDDCAVIRGAFDEDVECDVVHIHTLGQKTWPKLRKRGVGKIVSAHVIPASLVGSIKGARYWMPLARTYMKWYYRRADKVLAVSQMTKQSLIEELKVPEERIEVFYNTIDMSRYTPNSSTKKQARESLDIKSEAKVVVGVGQVQPRKRLDTFVEMAKEMPDVTFVWVGGTPFKQLGADYGKMQKVVKSSPDNLIVTDVIPHETVLEYLQAADIFCLPADQENHPMCVLEAAGAELPIVLRDIPEYEDTFKGDAILCKDDQEFIDAVRKLLGDESEYKTWVKRSNNIRDRFDSSKAAERLMEIYHTVV